MAAAMILQGKWALVTGGAVRIGRAICEVLAGAGCNVVVHYNRSGDEARELVARLVASGVSAAAVKGGLDSEAGAEALITEVWETAGSLDVLINNAGVFHKDGLSAATSAKLLAEFSVNAFAPMYLVRAFADRLLAGHGGGPGRIAGKVVNLLDRRIAGCETGCLPYLLSKKVLAEYTRIAALELAPTITVNAVAPGAILPPPGEGDARVRELAGEAPLRNSGTPQDVAEAVLYLLRSDAVTGQAIFVDGGQHLV
jgi:pteridine reductase